MISFFIKNCKRKNQSLFITNKKLPRQLSNKSLLMTKYILISEKFPSDDILRRENSIFLSAVLYDLHNRVSEIGNGLADYQLGYGGRCADLGFRFFQADGGFHALLPVEAVLYPLRTFRAGHSADADGVAAGIFPLCRFYPALLIRSRSAAATGELPRIAYNTQHAYRRYRRCKQRSA